MILTYDSHPIAVIHGNKIHPITKMLLTGDYSLLTEFKVILTTMDGVLVSPTIAFENEDILVEIDPLVYLYNSGNETNDEETLTEYNDIIQDYSVLFEVDPEELDAFCKEAEYMYTLLTTEEPLSMKAVEPKSIKLKPWIQALNGVKGFVTLASETVQMSSPESDVIVRLDKPSDIINGLDVSTQFAPLYDYSRDMQSILWRQYGIPEEVMIGTGETDYIDVLPNEEKLYKQLKQLGTDLLASSDINPDTNTGDYIAASPLFSEYMSTLIYRAIAANWKHTGLHFVITSEEEEVDDNDIDEDDEDSMRKASKNDNAVQGSNEQAIWTIEEKEEIEKKFLARGRTLKSITSAFTNVQNYIKTCNAQDGVDHSETYILCLIKLLRWGSRRPLRIRIGDMPRSLETDMFQVLDDFENSEKRLVEINGKSLMPQQRVITSINIPPNLKVKYGLVDAPLLVTTGIMCRQFYDIVDRPGKKIVETVYVDALNILDDEFKNNIIGLDFNSDTNSFELTEATTEGLILSKPGFSGSDRTVNGIVVANGSEKTSEYTLPDVLIDTVSRINIPNKKRAGLNMAYFILSQLGDGNLSEDSVSLLVKVLPYIKALPKQKSPTLPVNFLDVINAITNFKPTMSIPTSNAFEESTPPNAKFKLMESTRPMVGGFNVRNASGQIVAYFLTKPVFGIYSVNSPITGSSDHPQLASIDAVVSFVEPKLPQIKASVGSNIALYEDIANSLECLKAMK